VRAFASGALAGARAAPPPSVVPVQVDLNRASLGELLAVPGLGPARAEALILHRVRHGWFRSLDELDAVDGIGPGIQAQLRPWVRIGSVAETPDGR